MGKSLNLLKRIIIPFKIIGKIISSIVNFFLLLLVYIIGIGFTSVIAKRLFRKSFLDLSGKRRWIYIKEENKTLEDYERMF